MSGEEQGARAVDLAPLDHPTLLDGEGVWQHLRFLCASILLVQQRVPPGDARSDEASRLDLTPGERSQIREQSNGELALASFSISQRKSRLPAYLVEPARAGQGSEVNEYSIALSPDNHRAPIRAWLRTRRLLISQPI